MTSKSTLVAVLSAIVPLAVLFTVWEVLGRGSEIIGIFMPPPSIVFVELAERLANGSILTPMFLTLRKVFFAYSIAAVTAIPFGLFIGWQRRLYKALEPVIEALRPIPSLAMIAPAIIFLGLGDKTVMFVTLYAVFWIMLINSLYGIYGVDKVAMMAFKSMNAKQHHIFAKLMFPSALPYIFAGMRQAVAVALIVTVGAEMIVGSFGLGYFLLESERAFKYEAVYSSLLVLSALGYTLNKTFLTLERRILRWSKETGINT